MSQFTSAFDDLYTVQTDALGVAIVATVTGFCTNKPAIISEDTSDNAYLEGTTGKKGGYTLQMKQSDFSAEPTKNTQVTCNGNATGLTLQLTSIDLANAIYILTVGDIQSA